MTGRETIAGSNVLALTPDIAIATLIDRRLGRGEGTTGQFTGGHYSDTPNVLAHVRFNERTDAKGRKVLFVEEVQSDWHGASQGGGRHLRMQEVERRMKADGITKAEAVKLVPVDFGYLRLSRPEFLAKEKEAVLQTGGTEDYWEVRTVDGEFVANVTPNQGHANVSAERAVEIVNERIAQGEQHRYAHQSGLPDAPFKTTWPELAMKRMIRYAADSGADVLAWTTGEQQVQRYERELRKRVDRIQWTKTEDGVHLVGQKNTHHTGGYRVQTNGDAWWVEGFDGREVTPLLYSKKAAEEALARREEESYTDVVNTTEKETVLSDAIGKAMAKQILESKEQSGAFKGDQIKIDSTGMAEFYDRMLPSFMGKYGKRWGATVGETSIVLPQAEAGDLFAIEDERGRWMVEDDNAQDVTNVLFDTENEAREWMRSVSSLTGDAARETVHSIPVTQEMRQSVLYSGQAQFGRGAQTLYDLFGVQQEAARARIAKRGAFKGTQLGTFIPVNELLDLVIIGATKIGQGAITFADFSKRMLTDPSVRARYGDSIKSHLKDIYKKAKTYLATTKANNARAAAETARVDTQGGVAPDRKSTQRPPVNPELDFNGTGQALRDKENAGTIHPMELPELVELARDLLSTPRAVRRFRSMATRGQFSEKGIKVVASLFRHGNEVDLGKVLSHEIGHLVDWLPDHWIKRGNLLGRLRSLRSFRNGSFTGKNGIIVTNQEVRDELKALSMAWRPWDPETVTKNHARYRNSAVELYADALSALFYAPDYLRRVAPLFFEQWFFELDKKPDVKVAYFELQELIGGSREELIAARVERDRLSSLTGEETVRNRQRRMEEERKENRKHIWKRLKRDSLNIHWAFKDRVKQLRKQGIDVLEELNPLSLLTERNYTGGKLMGFTNRVFQPLVQALNDAEVSWVDFGNLLAYDRVLHGDRSENANPNAWSPQAMPEYIESVRSHYNAEQLKVVDDQKEAFRATYKEIVEEMYDNGMVTEKMKKQMDANPAYVPFRVIEHMELTMSAAIIKQQGTLKEIGNAATAGIMKMLASKQAIYRQQMMVKAITFLQVFQRESTLSLPGIMDREALKAAPTKWDGQRRVPQEPTGADKKRWRLVTLMKEGKTIGYWVDPYVARSLMNDTVDTNNVVMNTIKTLNSGFLRPVYVVFNVGFSTTNLWRDFWRTWRALSQKGNVVSLAKAARLYWKALPMAKVRAFGLSRKPSEKQLRALNQLTEIQEAGILSGTHNDFLLGHDYNEDTEIGRVLAGSIFEIQKTRPLALRPVMGALDKLKGLGDLIETLPKVASTLHFAGEGKVSDIPASRRQWIREKPGSPDFYAKGYFTPVTNEFFLFSNPMLQGWSSDIEVGTDPETRAGFWWKTVKLGVLPKMLQFAALYGGIGMVTALLSGGKDEDEEETDQKLVSLGPLGKVAPWWMQEDTTDALQRAMRGASEYDLSNYIIVPLGEDELGNSIIMRMPMDEQTRFISGLVWKALQMGRGDAQTWKSLFGIFNYTAGQIPSMTGVIGAALNATAMVTDRNIWDDFRGRTLFTDREMEEGGTQKWNKYLGWEFQNLGGGIVWKFYPGEARPREQTGLQRFLGLPIVSNVFGRWFKVTSYGETERLQVSTSPLRRQNAKRLRLETEAVNDAVREYQGLPEDDQDQGQENKYVDQVLDDLYGDTPERSERRRYVTARLRNTVLNGGVDPVASAMLGKPNAEKQLVIMSAARYLSKRELESDMDRWLQTGVISRIVYNQVYDALDEVNTASEERVTP